MVTISQMKEGMARYIDMEIASKCPGAKKWLVALAAASIVAQTDRMIEEHKTMLQASGYLTPDNLIDIDHLYHDLSAIAIEKGPITEHFPIIGDITFSSTDVDALRRYIG